MRSSGKEGFLGGFLDIIEVGVALMGRRGEGGEGHSRREIEFFRGLELNTGVKPR